MRYKIVNFARRITKEILKKNNVAGETLRIRRNILKDDILKNKEYYQSIVDADNSFNNNRDKYINRRLAFNDDYININRKLMSNPKELNLYYHSTKRKIDPFLETDKRSRLDRVNQSRKKRGLDSVFLTGKSNKLITKPKQNNKQFNNKYLLPALGLGSVGLIGTGLYLNNRKKREKK
jgi:hypothetical protein